jgi:DNA-binding phage protein
VVNAATERTKDAVEAAVGMVTLARELSVPVDMGMAQEHIYDALSAPGLDPIVRDTLRPLGLALGLSG